VLSLYKEIVAFPRFRDWRRGTAPAHARSFNARTRCIVIPNGVDTDYFAPVNTSEGPSCLMLVARMNDPVPVAYALHFYEEVYPLNDVTLCPKQYTP